MRKPVSRIVMAGALLVMLCVTTTAPLAGRTIRLEPRFVDNGDGTVTDHKTGLMWEKKTKSNLNDTFTWSSTGKEPDGYLFTSFLATMQCVKSLNGNCGLAGHYDWRIPNIAELRTILDCSQPNCVDPIFGLVAGSSHWSASTYVGNDSYAWEVIFVNQYVTVAITPKTTARSVRAVRSGL